MGARGPVPARDSELARPRERGNGKDDVTTKGVAYPTSVPNADREWHPIARRLWDGLKTSGQAAYYQNSDWAIAYSLCEDLSVYKKSGKRSGQMLQTIYSAMSNLLVTEGDRRRVRLELHEPEDDVVPASVTAISDYQRELGLVPNED